MKKTKMLAAITAALFAAALACSCQGGLQKAAPSDKATAAAAQSASQSGSPQTAAEASKPSLSASPASSAGTSDSPKPSASVSVTQLKPSLNVSAPAVSTAVSPAKPSLSIISPAVSGLKVTAPFQFQEMTYKSGGISIRYPQITGFAKTIQEKLNQLIADAAMRDLAAIKNDADLTSMN